MADAPPTTRDERDRDAAADDRPRGGRSGRGGGGGRPFRRRGCYFCETKEPIDYKNAALLRRFVADSGRIESRRKTMCCARHQRRLAVAIRRSRYLALLPHVVIRRLHG